MVTDSAGGRSQSKVVQWIGVSPSDGKGRKQKRAEPKENFNEVTPEQLVLLLELLLTEAELSVTSLHMIQRTYDVQNKDAEAMGVYLYGELMVQEDSGQQALARRYLSLVQDEKDQSARRVVEELVE
ncbi:aminopeptidase O-like [Salvelinus fontinalis]|uniref:aminopeptidase O-like n=1 Tax=Salvelinus fontinalis TaxID=8038 RepID=UPI002485A1CD|nr:aminopeptidase O-like [Salvelinus fontinalis]